MRRKNILMSPIEWRLLKRLVKDGLIAFIMSFPPCWYMFPEAIWIAWYISGFAVAAVMFSTALHWRFRRFKLTLRITKKNLNSW